jgi:hypothetical protein
VPRLTPARKSFGRAWAIAVWIFKIQFSRKNKSLEKYICNGNTDAFIFVVELRQIFTPPKKVGEKK